MKKILSVEEAIKQGTVLQQQNKTIVLAGGCFDILHIGHIDFLTKAKDQADILFLLLEHDATIKKKKGENRPINSQNDRARILASLEMVNYIIMLPATVSNEYYDDLVNNIKPAIIATTAGDPYASHKKRQAEKIQAKVVDVIKPIENQSTTKIISLLNEL